MTNFLSYARGPHLWAESQFVKANCCNQVDFCPFRGPDAPFALPRSYHEGREVGTDRTSQTPSVPQVRPFFGRYQGR